MILGMQAEQGEESNSSRTVPGSAREKAKRHEDSIGHRILVRHVPHCLWGFVHVLVNASSPLVFSSRCCFSKGRYSWGNTMRHQSFA